MDDRLDGGLFLSPSTFTSGPGWKAKKKPVHDTGLGSDSLVLRHTRAVDARYIIKNDCSPAAAL
jgi:hypothetical protein